MTEGAPGGLGGDTSVGVAPPRPHQQLTEDGRRVREVVTYSRRGRRLTDAQAGAWERRSGQWWIPDDALDAPGFCLDERYGRQAPLVVEIGSGIGEAAVALAQARPSSNVLAFEVWRPGVAQTFQRMESAGVSNVRVVSVDAVWCFDSLLTPESIAELWTLFPDPWPKKRHHRRRLVGPGFAALAASRLEPGAAWRLASDWRPYVDHIVGVLEAEPRLEGGAVARGDRPVTRFERRGERLGRPAVDLEYRRRREA